MNKSKLYDIVRYPVITEKATIASSLNKYIFKVDISSNKDQITKAISEIFNVKVKSINTILVKGKTKRFKGRIGKRNNYKKAIVTLEQGQTIDLAAEI